MHIASGSENETSPVEKKPELGPWFMESDVPILKGLVLNQFDVRAFNFLMLTFRKIFGASQLYWTPSSAIEQEQFIYSQCQHQIQYWNVKLFRVLKVFWMISSHNLALWHKSSLTTYIVPYCLWINIWLACCSCKLKSYVKKITLWIFFTASIQKLEHQLMPVELSNKIHFIMSTSVVV